MHIAVVAYTHYSTDPRVRREAEALAARGDTVEAFCLSREGRAKEEEINGVIVRRLPLKRYRGGNQARYLLSYIWFTVLAALYLSSGHIKKRYGLVHVHNMPDFVVFSALLPKLMGTKIVLDIHDLMLETFTTRFKEGEGGLLRRLIAWEERICTAVADHIITVHAPYKELLVQRGVPADKVSVVMNVPDDAIFDPDRVESSERTEGFLIVHHGTVVHRHGVDIAVRAVASLRKKIPGLCFRIIGEGDFLPEVKRLILDLGAGDVVELIDRFVPVDQLPPMLVEADLAVVPNRLTQSTQYILPVKLMEYVRLGIPAVVAKTPTVQQYFDPSMVCYFEPEDVDQLARCIQALYASPGKRRELVRNANRFTQKHNWEAEKQTVYQVVDRLGKETV
jgi:glycosyltransferase involved in cell wall biosynthesis